MDIFTAQFGEKLKSDLERVMMDDSIPSVAHVRDLVNRTEVVAHHVIAKAHPTGAGTVIHL